jgi:hypothetical protein
MPIQLRAAWDPVRTEALFSDGSSGEYDASARKRRSAETHSRNPISSLSRRFLPGAKILERNVMWQRQPAREPKPKRGTETWPEPDNYDKNPAMPTIRETVRGGELGTGQVGAGSKDMKVLLRRCCTQPTLDNPSIIFGQRRRSLSDHDHEPVDLFRRCRIANILARYFSFTGSI